MANHRFDSWVMADLKLPVRHQILLTAVAPRPIAFTGTIDAHGCPNLSPFSFFNAFGAEPAVVAISPAYGGRDGAPKHTYLNIKNNGEFTVSVVDYALVEQASLASCAYPAGVNEFVKAGLTEYPSQKIKPPGVAESPVIFECRLIHEIPLGGKPGSGNLLVGEILVTHTRAGVADSAARIDPMKLDLVARMGAEYYSRAREGMFELKKPTWNGIGFDALPKRLRESRVLTGNQLAQLAGVAQIPGVASATLEADPESQIAKLLDEGRIGDAWQVALNWLKT